LKVPELKQACRNASLPVGGTKTTLIERLTAHQRAVGTGDTAGAGAGAGTAHRAASSLAASSLSMQGVASTTGPVPAASQLLAELHQQRRARQHSPRAVPTPAVPTNINIPVPQQEVLCLDDSTDEDGADEADGSGKKGGHDGSGKEGGRGPAPTPAKQDTTPAAKSAAPGAGVASLTSGWACVACTFLNTNSTALACEVCATERA
jgi:hypothetical protein